MAADRKIPTNVSFTPRQDRAIQMEADRQGITFSEQLRKIVDGWIDTKPGLAQKLYEPAGASR